MSNDFLFLAGFLSELKRNVLNIHCADFFLFQAFNFFATGILMILTMKTFSRRFDFYDSGKPSLLTMQEGSIHTILMLLLKKKF